MYSMFTLASHISRNFYNELFKYPNVVGMGAGFKVSNDFNTLIPSLNIFVSKKYPKDSFSKQNLLPKHFMGSITDVVETGVFKPTSLTSKIRPVQMGYGIYNKNLTLGTAACIVLRKDPKPNHQAEDTYTSCILTTCHFATDQRKIENPIGDKVYQPKPGVISSLNAIGEIFDFRKIDPMENENGPKNYVDASLVKLMPANIATPTIAKIGVPLGITTPRVNLKIQVCGAYSELRTGEITEVGATVRSLTDPKNGIESLFLDQILTTCVAEPGDSGGALLTMNNRLLGLQFISSYFKTCHNTILNVMKYMDVIPYIQK